MQKLLKAIKNQMLHYESPCKIKKCGNNKKKN